MKIEKAKLPRGFVDKIAQEVHEENEIIKIIAENFELYGFEPLQTPMFEYSSVLGKFLPDDDRPNAGVFSLQDEDEQWLSLRYDLTAPLARYVAQNFEVLAKPYKSYRVGPVFRNEKAGPGRFRQFTQFDVDIVGAASVNTDVEMCVMMADILEKLGVKRGLYLVKLNNRKVLDALLETINLPEENLEYKKLQILRSIDKFDKFGKEGVNELLGPGRLDESGDFTKGVGLDKISIDKILSLLESNNNSTCVERIELLESLIGKTQLGQEAINELREMQQLIANIGYQDRIKIDTSVVRGLEYYTGPVFEAQLLFDVLNSDGQKIVFGAVGGGGRYDNLVSRFQKTLVPATGFSIGVSRLIVALKSLNRHNEEMQYNGPVVILRMDKDIESLTAYHKIAQTLRANNIACELYSGDSGMKAQMKYADRKKAPCVIIQGSREREENIVQIKDLAKGAQLAKSIDNNETWRLSQPAQISVKLDDIVLHIQKILNAEL